MIESILTSRIVDRLGSRGGDNNSASPSLYSSFFSPPARNGQSPSDAEKRCREERRDETAKVSREIKRSTENGRFEG